MTILLHLYFLNLTATLSVNKRPQIIFVVNLSCIKGQSPVPPAFIVEKRGFNGASESRRETTEGRGRLLLNSEDFVTQADSAQAKLSERIPIRVLLCSRLRILGGPL